MTGSSRAPRGPGLPAWAASWALCAVLLGLAACTARPGEPAAPPVPAETPRPEGPPDIVGKLAANAATARGSKRALFSAGAGGCYARDTMPTTAAVDLHLYHRPVAELPLALDALAEALGDAGVIAAALLGQRRPVPGPRSAGSQTACPGPGPCPDASPRAEPRAGPRAGLPLGLPSGLPLGLPPELSTDIATATAILAWRGAGDGEIPSRDGASRILTVAPAYGFADLKQPATIAPNLTLLDGMYPGLFKAMGEAILVDTELFEEAVMPVARETIAGWAPFMERLEAREQPLFLHADLGTDDDPTRFLPLLEEVLTRYPGTRIVWSHLGLSPALADFSPQDHAALVAALLTRYPNLYGDLSLLARFRGGFKEAATRTAYGALLEAFPARLLPGTAFSAAAERTSRDYRRALQEASLLFADLSDEAFRGIALGQGAFRLLGLPLTAPKICTRR